MTKIVYLGLGSNVGDRNGYLTRALSLLGNHPSIDLIKVSSFIENTAVSSYKQPDYLNGVCYINTILTYRELLTFTQEVELQLGRLTKGMGDPRTIDIDILFYDNEIISEDDCVIPHALLHERDFVLKPLFEIAPDFVHPILQETIESIYLSKVGY